MYVLSQYRKCKIGNQWFGGENCRAILLQSELIILEKVIKGLCGTLIPEPMKDHGWLRSCLMKGLKAGTEIFRILFAFVEKIWKVERVGFCESVFLFICGQTFFFPKQTKSKRKANTTRLKCGKGTHVKGTCQWDGFFDFFYIIRFGTNRLHNCW